LESASKLPALVSYTFARLLCPANDERNAAGPPVKARNGHVWDESGMTFRWRQSLP
jgi:hypothetical protein